MLKLGGARGSWNEGMNPKSPLKGNHQLDGLYSGHSLPIAASFLSVTQHSVHGCGVGIEPYGL